jgi:peptidoglycan/LPS O-acetylase OafA/YrhL
MAQHTVTPGGRRARRQESRHRATPMPPAPSTPAAPARARARFDEFDVMRGVAIVMVLYLHSYFSNPPGTPASEILALHVSHLFAQTAVPVFLFISGFLLALDRAPDARTYATRRVHRIVLPTAIWMTASLAWVAWRAGGLDRTMLREFALFGISGQYYYLAVLVILMVAGYPVRHWSARRLAVVAAGAFLVNFAAIAFYQVHGLGTGLSPELAYRNPLVWVSFYAFGLYTGRARGTPQWGPRVVAAAAAALAVVFAVTVAWGVRTGEYPISYFGVSMFLISSLSLIVFPALVVVVGRHRLGALTLAPFRALAPYAFAIYLVHKPFFVGYLSDRLVSHSVLRTDYLQLMLGLFVVGGGAAILFVVAAARLGGRRARTLIGVDPPHA